MFKPSDCEHAPTSGRAAHRTRRSRLLRGLGASLALLLAACQTTPAHSNDSSQSMRFGGLDRSWIVHLPAHYDASRKWPLVLVFHGLFGTSSQMEDLTGFDAVADRDGFIVVYPQGIKRSWAAGVNAPADNEGVNDVGFTAALLDRLEKQYPIDPRHVVATGFSNGAHLSQLLGCRLADRFSAIAPVSGEMPPDEPGNCHPSRPISVVSFHGTADPIDPFEGGKVNLSGGSQLLSAPATIAFWARRNGCAAKPLSSTIKALTDGIAVHRLLYPSCKDGVKVALYRVDGAGHTWPGGDQYLPQFMIGRASHAVNASDIIGALATGK